MTLQARRTLLRAVAGLGYAAASLALMSSACEHVALLRPGKVSRIGFLAPGTYESLGSRADAFLNGLRDQLPAMFEARDYLESGVLMSYSANYPAIFRRAAVYVDKVVQGAQPTDLPIEQPTEWDLTVKPATLQFFGLSIPPSLVPLVSEWIQ